jgi:hypothetical protein
MTSGDIQYGVPTNVFFLAESVPESWPETPKSASLTSPPADRRMLAAVARVGQKQEYRALRRQGRTFDVPVKLALRVEVIQAPEQLADDNGDVLLSEDARLHLQGG